MTFYTYSTFSNKFRRPFPESKGYGEKWEDGKCYLVVNVLGLSKDDLEIKRIPAKNETGEVLSISGKVEDEKFGEFSVSPFFSFPDRIDEIEAEVDNGLLKMEISFVKPEVEKLNISWK